MFSACSIVYFLVDLYHKIVLHMNLFGNKIYKNISVIFFQTCYLYIGYTINCSTVFLSIFENIYTFLRMQIAVCVMKIVQKLKKQHKPNF